MKQSWKSRGIEDLEIRYGLDRNMAETLWRRAYNQAYRRVKLKAHADINISREVYGSLFSQGTQLFDITLTDTSVGVQLAGRFQDIEELDRAFIEARFAKMSMKYKQVDKWVQRYKRGRMSKGALLDKVQKFKDTNREYLKAGSG